MGKRADGYYPTDPVATAALRAWMLERYRWLLIESWQDACAGYGGLLEGLGVPRSQRHAIEIDGRHRDELVRRVPESQVQIGDGLVLPWQGKHAVLNPDFASPIMTAFVRRALAHQQVTRGLVVVLALGTWWHSGALRGPDAVRAPSHVLVPAKRVSCNGSGIGDMRPIDWLVWVPGHTGTVVEWLPPVVADAALVAEHRRLAVVS